MTAPARTTRNDASPNGDRYSSPIFTAIKLSAQTTMTSAIEAVITRGLGARRLAVSILTNSDQMFFSNRKFFDALAARFETDAGTRGYANRTLRRDRNFRIDDVFIPVAFAGSNITREGEIGKGRECDIVRAADAGFEHAAAPDGDAVTLAEIVDAPRNGVTADTAKLDVDDLAGAQFDGGTRLLFRMNALIQTNWGVEFLLKFDVAVEVVPAERLFDHHQVEAFELFQQRPVIQSVGRVCVNHQLDAGDILPRVPSSRRKPALQANL